MYGEIRRVKMLHCSYHRVMGNLFFFFPATLQPQTDHTYSCISHDSTNSGEGVDIGTQVIQPVIHAETQTQDMVGYCFIFKNSYSINCSVLCCLKQLFLNTCPFQAPYVLYQVGTSFSDLG